jgi:hypothetical protein
MIRQIRMSTDEGVSVIIQYPEPVSGADLEDIKATVAIWLRSLERISAQYRFAPLVEEELLKVEAGAKK